MWHRKEIIWYPSTLNIFFSFHFPVWNTENASKPRHEIEMYVKLVTLHHYTKQKICKEILLKQKQIMSKLREIFTTRDKNFLIRILLVTKHYKWSFILDIRDWHNLKKILQQTEENGLAKSMLWKRQKRWHKF